MNQGIAQTALHTPPRKGKTNAFTLIELLVVIAIISLLVSILVPSLQRAKDMAKVVDCLSRVKNLSLAMAMYQHDYDGVYPSMYGDGQIHTNPDGSQVYIHMWVFALLNSGLIETPTEKYNSLVCPFDASALAVLLINARSYACNFNLSYPQTSCAITPIKPETISNPGDTIFISEWWHGDWGMESAYGVWWNPGWSDKSSGPTFDHHNDGRSTVLFFDSHAENVEEQDVGDGCQYRWEY